MKSIVSLMLIVSVFFPVVAHAAVLKTINVSSVQTGGIKAEGKTISTGSSSASAEVYTKIKAGNTGGTVEIKVETEVDGAKRTEHIKKWWGGFWGKVRNVFWFF